MCLMCATQNFKIVPIYSPRIIEHCTIMVSFLHDWSLVYKFRYQNTYEPLVWLAFINVYFKQTKKRTMCKSLEIFIHQIQILDTRIKCRCNVTRVCEYHPASFCAKISNFKGKKTDICSTDIEITCV